MDGLTDHQTVQHETDKDGRRKLEVGMLLLTDDEKFPKLYCVSKVNKTNAHLICHHDTMYEDATLTRPYVPDGWLIIPNRSLAWLCRTITQLEGGIQAHATLKKGTV